MSIRCEVRVSKFAEKQLNRLPKYVKEHFLVWAQTVETVGLRRTRLCPGYHDEPLHGTRAGQRSIRLTRSHRVIYEENNQRALCIVAIIEVNHHEY